MKEVRSIPNAYRTFEAVRNLGYNFNSAVADIIDNSFTKLVNCTSVSISFKEGQKHTITLIIQDNGCGMLPSDLENAMKLGSERLYDSNDLGKFGMGMKSASLSQCHVLTVLSLCQKGVICGYRWDMNHIEKNRKDVEGGWKLLQLERNDVKEVLKKNSITMAKQGTVVIWDEMFWVDQQFKHLPNEKDRNTYLFKVKSELSLHLGMTFHRFLDGSIGTKKQITIDGTRVKPWDPFCRKETYTTELSLSKPKSEIFIPGCKHPVIVRAYILPSKEQFSSEAAWKNGKGLLSWNDAQGYYIYRENRIIRFGGWQGTKAKDEHDKLARLSIDIDSSLDEQFRITVNKARMQFPEILFQKLKAIVNPEVVKKAKQAYKNSGDSVEVVNRFRKQGPVITGVVKKMVQNVETSVTANGKSVSVTNSNGVWLSNQVADFLKIGNREDFEIISTEFHEDFLWKIVCHPKKKFKVLINSEHPFYQKLYRTSTQKNVSEALDAMFCALALAELMWKNEKNAYLFDGFKSSTSLVLKKLIENKAL